MKTLRLGQTYTREEVHSIFSPNTTFTPQAGSWGLHGIVPLPERPSSFVFFVTLGRIQGHHTFDESVTEDGVLTWQSQPQQKLDSPMIKTLIRHDDLVDSIQLFLRARAAVPYTYLGTLGYLTHDEDRQQPVHFQWQLMEWPAQAQAIRDMGLKLAPTADGSQADASVTAVSPIASHVLVERPPPTANTPGPSRTAKFEAVKMGLHPDQDARNKALGRAGEDLVLKVEQDRLKQAGRPDLAARIVHVSVIEGDGAGYDIRSFALDGTVRHLEVKTTRNGASTAFFLSPNEINFSAAFPDSFELVRVYHYDTDRKSGECYRVLGPLERHFNLVPNQFRAVLIETPR